MARNIFILISSGTGGRFTHPGLVELAILREKWHENPRVIEIQG